jgi:hypothetical protein
MMVMMMTTTTMMVMMMMIDDDDDDDDDGYIGSDVDDVIDNYDVDAINIFVITIMMMVHQRLCW